MTKWTPEKDRELARLAETLTNPKIANLMGRSPEEIRGRLAVLGVRRPIRWTRTMDDWLCALVETDAHSFGGAARIMGLPKDAVTSRWRRIVARMGWLGEDRGPERAAVRAAAAARAATSP